MTQRNLQDLDKLFAAVREAEPSPPARFIELALANAYAAQPIPTPRPAGRRVEPGLLSLFGGWKAVSALAASVLAGFWIGYADWQGLASAGPFASLFPSLDDTFSSLDAFDASLTAFEDPQT